MPSNSFGPFNFSNFYTVDSQSASRHKQLQMTLLRSHVPGQINYTHKRKRTKYIAESEEAQTQYFLSVPKTCLCLGLLADLLCLGQRN